MHDEFAFRIRDHKIYQFEVVLLFLEFKQVPNGFGCFLGALQLILCAIYRKNKDQIKRSPTSKGGAVTESAEMGSHVHDYKSSPKANHGEQIRDNLFMDDLV